MKKSPDITLEAASAQARILILVLTVGLPFLITSIALAFFASDKAATPNLIGDSLSVTLIIVLFVQTLLTTGLWYFLNRAMSRHRIEWQTDGFTVLTSFYKQAYLHRDLLLDAASIINLENDKEHRPILKTNGYAVPGFKSGWFRLRNKQSAFCAIGPGRKILMIPTNKGHCLMLGTLTPDKTLEQLKQWALDV